LSQRGRRSIEGVRWGDQDEERGRRGDREEKKGRERRE